MISSATRAWLSTLPLRHQADPFMLVHGSPTDPTWEYVFSVGTARRNLDAFDTGHCLLGHTHVPLAFRQQGRQVEPVVPDGRSPLRLDERRTLVNPGSVGQPRDGDPRACAMLIDTRALTVEWRRVEYPVERVQQLMVEAGLPRRLVRRLELGL